MVHFQIQMSNTNRLPTEQTETFFRVESNKMQVVAPPVLGACTTSLTICGVVHLAPAYDHSLALACLSLHKR